jgi:hypothetical protein
MGCSPIPRADASEFGTEALSARSPITSREEMTRRASDRKDRNFEQEKTEPTELRTAYFSAASCSNSVQMRPCGFFPGSFPGPVSFASRLS